MSGGTEFKDAVPTYRKLTFQHEPPPYRFIEADIRRACKAAPDRTIEIVFPDGTIIRLLPCDKLNLPSRKLRRKGRSGFKWLWCKFH